MSQESAPERFDSIEDLDVIVDADAHITDRLDEFLPYMDEKHKGIQQLIEAEAMPLANVFSFGRATPSHPFSGTTGSDVATMNIDTPEEKTKGMDEFGIDYGIVNPTLMAALNSVNNPRYATGIVNAYNNWLGETWLDTDDRYKLIISVPPQKPEKGVEEIEKWGDEDNVIGIALPATGLLPPPGHEWYDPIYAAAEEKDLLVFLHTAGNITMYAFPTQQRWNETEAEGHAMAHPFTHMWNLSTMIFRGIPERFPDLNFIFQEAGIGWIPYWKWRLDDHYLERNYDAPLLEQLPSKYIDESFYFTTQPLGHTTNPEHLAKMIELAGPKNILWASDLPHPDFDTPEELFNRINGYFEPDVIRGIMGETAADLFGFEY